MPDEKDFKRFEEYIKSEKAGGGIAKCHPLSYIQGNFAYYNLKL